MKILFSIILVGSLFISKASAQVGSAKAPSVDVVIPPSQQMGNTNYLLSLSDQDFKNQKYIFYTDSSATVAYIKIDGVGVRLTGGPNPENIMAYTCKGYTVTLNTNKKTPESATNNNCNYKIQATLVIYRNSGSMAKQVTGVQINVVKK
jgi:hypothetical protein